jgi:hypothetical protein
VLPVAWIGLGLRPVAQTLDQEHNVDDNMNDPTELVERYAAIWNEPDAARCRHAVTELWSEEAVHILQLRALGWDALHLL